VKNGPPVKKGGAVGFFSSGADRTRVKVRIIVAYFLRLWPRPVQGEPLPSILSACLWLTNILAFSSFFPHLGRISKSHKTRHTPAQAIRPPELPFFSPFSHTLPSFVNCATFGCWLLAERLRAESKQIAKGRPRAEATKSVIYITSADHRKIGDAFVEHILDIFMCPPRSWTRTGPTEEPVISVEFTDSFEHPAKAGEGYIGPNALCWTLFDHFATHFHTLPSPETSPSLVTIDAYMVTPSPAERVPGRSPLLRICRPGTFGVC